METGTAGGRDRKTGAVGAQGQQGGRGGSHGPYLITLTTSGADWCRFDRLGFFGEAEAAGAILSHAKRDRHIITLTDTERGAGGKRGSQMLRFVKVRNVIKPDIGNYLRKPKIAIRKGTLQTVISHNDYSA